MLEELHNKIEKASFKESWTQLETSVVDKEFAKGIVEDLLTEICSEIDELTLMQRGVLINPKEYHSEDVRECRIITKFADKIKNEILK